jgi:hypothetical protein
MTVSRWRLGRFAVVATVFGTLVVPPAAAAAAAGPPPDPGEVHVAVDYTQRSGSRSRDVTGDGVPDIVARQPGLDNGALWVYPGSGALNGTSTLTARGQIGRGWNIFNWIGVAEVTGDTEDPETKPEMPADVLARRTSDGALLVYPHSGTYNGFNTLQTPVVVGLGWNGMSSIVLADVTGDGFDDIIAYDTADNLWLYPHSRVFNGTSTFTARILVRQGRLGWLYVTEWTNDFPDLATNFIATGDMQDSPHLREVNGTGTWRQASTQISSGQFTGDLLDIMIVADLTADGRDDVVVRGLDGALVVFPFNRINGLGTFGSATVIGAGWHVMDVIT